MDRTNCRRSVRRRQRPTRASPRRSTSSASAIADGSVGWPELYDEMCAVAGRGLYRGYSADDLAAIGDRVRHSSRCRPSPRSSHRVVAEDQERRRRSAARDPGGPRRADRGRSRRPRRGRARRRRRSTSTGQVRERRTDRRRNRRPRSGARAATHAARGRRLTETAVTDGRLHALVAPLCGNTEDPRRSGRGSSPFRACDERLSRLDDAGRALARCAPRSRASERRSLAVLARRLASVAHARRTQSVETAVTAIDGSSRLRRGSGAGPSRLRSGAPPRRSGRSARGAGSPRACRGGPAAGGCTSRRRLVIRTWSRFFIRTSGSIAARSDGWYICFIGRILAARADAVRADARARAAATPSRPASRRRRGRGAGRPRSRRGRGSGRSSSPGRPRRPRASSSSGGRRRRRGRSPASR